jgi:hypothetical protein
MQSGRKFDLSFPYSPQAKKGLNYNCIPLHALWRVQVATFITNIIINTAVESVYKSSDSDSFIKAQYVLTMINL